MSRPVFHIVPALLLLAGWALNADAFSNQAFAGSIPFQQIDCEGQYKKHVQGVCTDGRRHLFWSFTTELLRTDKQGKILHKILCDDHHGDLCYQDGRIYVAVNLGKFNQPAGQAKSWIYVYDAETLKEISRHSIPEVVHGAGGIEFHKGHFYIVGGLPKGTPVNYVYQYSPDFKLVKEFQLQGGETLLGIQTATFAEGHWWFGCYGKPAILLKASEDLSKVERFEFDCALGLVPLGGEKFLVARDPRKPGEQCQARLLPAKVDATKGLSRVK